MRPQNTSLLQKKSVESAPRHPKPLEFREFVVLVLSNFLVFGMFWVVDIFEGFRVQDSRANGHISLYFRGCGAKHDSRSECDRFRYCGRNRHKRTFGPVSGQQANAQQCGDSAGMMHTHLFFSLSLTIRRKSNQVRQHF